MAQIPLVESRDVDAFRNSSVRRGPESPQFLRPSNLAVEALSDRNSALITLTLENAGEPDGIIPLTPPDALKLSRELQRAVRKYLGGEPPEKE